MLDANSPEARSVMIVTEISGRNGEPGWKRRSGVWIIRPQPPEIGLSQFAENIRIALHCVVVIAAEGTRDGDEQSRMATDQFIPCCLSIDSVGSAQEPTEL